MNSLCPSPRSRCAVADAGYCPDKSLCDSRHTIRAPIDLRHRRRSTRNSPRSARPRPKPVSRIRARHSTGTRSAFTTVTLTNMFANGCDGGINSDDVGDSPTIHTNFGAMFPTTGKTVAQSTKRILAGSSRCIRRERHGGCPNVQIPSRMPLPRERRNPDRLRASNIP